MRVQLELPERTVEKLKALMNEVGAKTYSEIFGYALTGLDWMAKERRQGDSLSPLILTSINFENYQCRFWMRSVYLEQKPVVLRHRQGLKRPVRST